MTIVWSDVGWAALFFVVSSALLSAAMTLVFRWRTADHLAREVAAGRLTAESAYAWYLARLIRAQRFEFLVCAALLALAPASGVAGISILGVAFPLLPAAILGGLGALVITAWYATQTLLSAATQRRKAYFVLRGWAAPKLSSFAQQLKLILARYLPVLTLVEAAAVATASGQLGLLLLLPPICGAGFLLHGALLAVEQRWLIRSAAIEDTEWASLAPRIQTWARRAGMHIGAIRVLFTERYGTAGASLLGPGGLATLFLSDNLLKATDWRQSDALVALLCGERRLLRTIRFVPTLFAVTEGAALAGLFGVLSYAVATLPSDGLLLAIAAGMVGVVVIGRYVIGRASGGYPLERPVFLGDRFGAELVGDPLAAMVALHTLSTLRGYLPLAEQRIRALDRLPARAGPRAPWAMNAVPSGIAWVWQGTSLTTPLDAAPPPSPVPEVAYPVDAPLAAKNA